MGLAWDSKGRLWFSSDSTGEIFVMKKDGSSGGDNSGNGENAAAGGMVPVGAVVAGAAAVAALLMA